jgi:hypothetical protein
MTFEALKARCTIGLLWVHPQLGRRDSRDDRPPAAAPGVCILKHRAHLFEFNDWAHTPDVLRQAETDALRGLEALAGVPSALAKLLDRLIAEVSPERIVDLASGGTGPLLPALAHQDVDVVCTDWFPSSRAAQLVARHRPTARYLPEPVDAAAVPRSLTGLRTVINALHHFSDDDARAVLADASRAGQPIVVVELLNRRWRDAAMTIAIPLGVLAVMPFVRPSFGALLATYLVPIVPLMVGFDGLVSCLRARSQRELLALTAGLDGLTWTVGKQPAGLVDLTFLVGVPTR